MDFSSNYITLDECEDFVIWLFPRKVLADVQWVTLSDEDKQIYLNYAHNIINALPYKGYTVELGQECAFPRIINNTDTGIPEKLKHCVAYLAVKLLQSDSNKRKQLMREGVSEIRVDKITEKYFINGDFESDINLKTDKQINGMLKGLVKINGLC